MYYFLLTLTYDGCDYYGWAKQKNVVTIQGELEKILFKITKINIWTLGASRTDQKVHARGQKVLIKLPFLPRDINYFFKTLSFSLPDNIRIISWEQVHDSFNVRCAKEKTYTYTINDSCYNVFKARYQLFINYSLTIKKLMLAADIFLGTHNFLFFSGVKENETIKTVRTINSINFDRKDNNSLVITITGPSFIRYQIRMVIGNLLAFHQNKITLMEINNLLISPPKNKNSNFCAPPYGLCLEKICY